MADSAKYTLSTQFCGELRIVVLLRNSFKKLFGARRKTEHSEYILRCLPFMNHSGIRLMDSSWHACYLYGRAKLHTTSNLNKLKKKRSEWKQLLWHGILRFIRGPNQKNWALYGDGVSTLFLPMIPSAWNALELTNLMMQWKKPIHGRKNDWCEQHTVYNQQRAHIFLTFHYHHNALYRNRIQILKFKSVKMK